MRRQHAKNMTDAERLLWQYLRNRYLSNYKFRRQHPIDAYIVDFVCTEKRLIIEIDGGQHNRQKSYDNGRTRRLKQQGYTVLRFWNNEVITHTEEVLEEILEELDTLTPLLAEKRDHQTISPEKLCVSP